jgi:hypothetical protein
MNSIKQSDESIKAYFTRICTNRESLGLTWDNVRDLMNKETGKKYTESKYRKQWVNYKEGLDDGFQKAIDEDEPLKENELSLLKIKQEKVLLQDNRSALALQIRAKARFENIINELKIVMDEKLEPLIVKSCKNDGNEEKLIVAAFSDFHVGAEFDSFFGKYSIEIFKRRLEEYTAKIISIGKINNIDTVKILSLGDIISGLLHISIRIQNAENVITQIKIASEYVAQSLAVLAKNFKTVEYYTALGNHGRVTPSKEETLYNENLESFVPWYVKARVEKISNVTIMENEVDEGIIVANIFDEVIFGAHGDKDSFQKAAVNLPVMLRKFPISIWIGHLHSFGVETYHGIEVIKSGCLGGTDEYAKDKRLTGKPCQTVAIYNREGLESIFNINFK